MTPSGARDRFSTEGGVLRVSSEPWVLVERYVEHFPDDWRLVFKKGDEVLTVQVPQEVWRAFDS